MTFHVNAHVNARVTAHVNAQRGTPPARRAHSGLELNSLGHDQCDQNYQEQTETAARVVAPAGAVWPGRKSAQDQQDYHDQKNQSKHCRSSTLGGRLARGCADASARCVHYAVSRQLIYGFAVMRMGRIT